ncbi:MAG: hypothetical protein EOO46_14305 [Flavobacterium sp.]|nr:MAG: hypothetical protein EOO46_14305 [Flavobacterium sp.]
MLPSDDIIAVNSTQTTDIAGLKNDLDELRNDHDTHVSTNAVLINSDQSIGANKSFSNNLITKGIENSNDIETPTLHVTSYVQVGNESIIHATKPVTTDSLVLSTGTTGMLVGEATIPSKVQRIVHWNIPINLKSDVVAPLYGTSIDVTNT